MAAIVGLSIYGLQEVPAASRATENELEETLADVADENATARAKAAERLAAYQFCNRRTSPLLSALNDLGSRLDVGLAFAEYGERVGDISVAYQKLRPGSLGPACLEVAVPLETAYRKYAAAYNIWNDCIGDFGCSTESIEPQLQAKWLEADGAVQRGRGALASMK